ncbi:hypothetical protein Moror_1378 [Moniliophthora roreri MCA 2997]|uniref:Tat pathway signal sequence n=2 Tax=Moniliophthora roreri TaxID=221103 RepID=V2WRN3_MONRO|nr:hypothetical protein Moror_1378 [Moniliophthora roreri MCA 2997]KAI3620926.1 hypothetical protein WG66_006309 [Moniliophthora roreri]
MGRQGVESTQYAPLLQEESALHDDVHVESSSSSRCRHRFGIIVGQFLMNLVVLLALVIVVWARLERTQPLLYSPANHLLEEKLVTFRRGPEEQIYREKPSPEVDKAWEDLYAFQLTKISKREADQLVNKTTRLTYDPDHYLVELDVFHQLHCLNMIRKTLHSDYYKSMKTDEVEDPATTDHVVHCIDHIRRSIMCASDVSPNVFQWDTGENTILGNLAVLHSCRDFNRIKEWARERELQPGELDQYTQPDD